LLRNLPMSEVMTRKIVRPALFFGLLLLLATACVQRQSVATDGAGQPEEIARQLLASGCRSFQGGEYGDAMRFFREAMVIARGVDAGAVMALAAVNMAETSLALGDEDAAGQNLGQARRLVRREGLAELRPRLDLVAANLAVRAGRGGEAFALLAPYLSAASPQVGGELRLAALVSRVQLAFAAEEGAAARQWLDRYRQAVAALAAGAPRHAAQLLRFEARLCYREGDQEGGDRRFAEAVAIYRAGAVRPGLAAGLAEWGRLLMAAKQWEAARDRLDRAFFVRVAMADRHGADETLALLEQLDRASGDRLRAAETRQWREVLHANSPLAWADLLPGRSVGP